MVHNKSIFEVSIHQVIIRANYTKQITKKLKDFSAFSNLQSIEKQGKSIILSPKIK